MISINTFAFFSYKDKIVVLENGYFMTVQFLETNGFKDPILVQKSEGLDLVVPPKNFTVFDVEQHVGNTLYLRMIHLI